MRTRTSVSLVAGLACVFALMLAGPSIGQKVTQRPLRENPYRDVGGACIYGKHGEVLFSPKGTKCEERTDHPLDASGRPSMPPFVDALPPAVRGEARAMIEDHDHLADEITRLRQAIAEGQRQAALEAADHIVAGLTQHLAREEQLLEQLAAEHEAHRQGDPAHDARP